MRWRWIGWIGCTVFAIGALAEEGVHPEHGHEEERALQLTPAQREAMGIVSRPVAIEARAGVLRAPAVVHFNGYRTADVALPLDGIVHRRFVRLGQKVQQGDPLLSVISTALAAAEGEYLKSKAAWEQARAEYDRLKPLAKQRVVSQARLQQAERALRTARARWMAARAMLLAYGLDEAAIERLAQSERLGLLRLRAPIAGTVVADDFVQGQFVPAGTRLVRIVDERTVWVEARLSASQLEALQPGLAARVLVPGTNRAYAGKVVALLHRVDATTRTGAVRLLVNNPDDALHEGMFVQAEIALARKQRGIWLPEEAVQRQGEEWIVFVESAPGRYERRKIEVDPPQMGWVRVRRGLRVNERVVVRGAFALLAELEKSGFAAH